MSHFRQIQSLRSSYKPELSKEQRKTLQGYQFLEKKGKLRPESRVEYEVLKQAYAGTPENIEVKALLKKINEDEIEHLKFVAKGYIPIEPRMGHQDALAQLMACNAKLKLAKLGIYVGGSKTRRNKKSKKYKASRKNRR